MGPRMPVRDYLIMVIDVGKPILIMGTTKQGIQNCINGENVQIISLHFSFSAS